MEEIVIQRCGNAFEQGDVDAVLAENPVDMGAGAANVLGQLCGRNALLPHYLFDMLPDVHEKSVEYVQLAEHRVSTPIYQQVIPRQNTLALHNDFLVESLSRNVENGVQEFVFEMLFYRIMCLF